MCDRDIPVTETGDGYSKVTAYEADHPFLSEVGMPSREAYFVAMIQKWSNIIGFIARCPERSDAWLNGEGDFIVNRYGGDEAGSLVRRAVEDPWSRAGEDLAKLLKSIEAEPEAQAAWRAGEIHLHVDHRGPVWKATKTGLPLSDDDLPGMYL